MSSFLLILGNSFGAAFFFSFNSDSLYFAALAFDHISPAMAVTAAMIGSVIGLMVNYALGAVVARNRGIFFRENEERYLEICDYFRKYGVFILLFQMIPFIRLFFLFAGMFMVGWRRVLLFAILGRIVYYTYYHFFPYTFFLHV